MAARSGDRSLVSAFNLVPLVDQVLQDKQIECVCYWDKVLYIGTVDGMILCYNITSIKSPYGKIIYQPKIKSRRQLDSDKKKHLQQLTIIPNMNRLIALLDGSLYLLDMHKLEVIDTRDRITKVICYCIDEARTSSFYNQCEVVVAQLKKKSISVYTLANDKFQLSRDIAVSDQPVTMSRDGDNLCVALSTNFFDAGRYTLINLQTNEIVPLPSYEMGVTPFIKRTTKDEFLINNGELGLIVTSDGTSNRPPVEWKSISPTAACYHFPYIIVWSEKTRKIHVFSLIDQMLKQEISFTDSAPRYMGQFHSKLYVAFNSGVYLIVPVPLKDQVTDLLENGKVEEAILLAETIAAVDEVKNPDMAIEYISDIKKRAAFICFSQGQYSKSETLLVEGNVDPREIISKFDNLLIKSSTYVPAVHIPTAEELAEDGKIKLTEARKFLIRYLKDVRTSSLSLGRKEEIDTALVKLLAQETTPSLTNYMQNYDMFLNFEEAKDSFEKNQRYFALGLLCFYNGSPDDALDIWTRIYDKKLADDHFPGFDYITDFITKYVNNDLLLKYSTWILNHDQRKGAAVFIHQPESIGKIRPALPHNVVLEKLSLYVEASMMYLEHLIHDLNSKEENFHTRLGMLYLERVLKLKDENELELLTEARTKLKAFLEESTLYRASVLLNRVQDTDLYHECAILYGRMDDHEKALDLLAHKVQDYDEAERYCHMNSKVIHHYYNHVTT
jgi:tetratricopeptide (TPR) repeat protein